MKRCAHRGTRAASATLLTAVLATGIAATAQAQTTPTLKQLTIEELLDLDVTTAQRHAEPVRVTPAAVSVITRDDLRRSGAVTIADALQLADGLYIGRVNNSTWRIDARGLNSSVANKLLVMVDGRVVDSSLFTGVFWNVVSYPLEDIDRIEITRGPGAALWGANAVNGVINIITRSSADTQGVYVSAASGNEDRGLAQLRYGGRTAAATWRTYGRFGDRADSALRNGATANDRRRFGQAGFRIDGSAARPVSWTVIGDLFHSQESFVTRLDGEYTEAALQARLSVPTFTSSRLDVQTFYRREYRRAPSQLTHAIDVIDIDAQQATTLRPRHQIIWGGGVRVSADDTYGTSAFFFDPVQRTYGLTSLFGQDEIALVPGRLFATVGAKFEHNAFSGGDLQPNLRARWLLAGGHTLWGAFSHAVRRPTRFDDDVRISSADGAATLEGNPDFQPESVVATELGYRAQLGAAWSIDLTAFNHDFDDLRSVEAPRADGGPLVFGNTLTGHTRGVETALNVQPVRWWRTHVGYTLTDTHIRPAPDSRDISGGVLEANDPHHLYQVRTSLDLPHRLEFDALLHGVSALPMPALPGYSELNLRLGWRASARTEIFVAGRDLLHDRHAELPPAAATTQQERAFRVGVALRY